MKYYFTTFSSSQASAILPGVSKEIRFSFAEVHFSRYVFAADFVTGKDVLDVASTWGYGSRYLFEKGAKSIVGGEIPYDAVKCAQLCWKRKGTEFIVLDACSLPFADNSFDVVVSLETIEHLEKYEEFLIDVKRVLKDGGLFICSTPYKNFGISGVNFKFLPEHFHEFYPEELQELLSKYFVEIQLYGHEYWNEREMGMWKIRFKIENLLKHFPPLFRFTESLYIRFIRHDQYIEFTQKTRWDEISTEQYKPAPYLVGSSPIPRDIIAVARK